MAANNCSLKETMTSGQLNSDLKNMLQTHEQKKVTPAPGFTNWISSAFQRIWSNSDHHEDVTEEHQKLQKKEELTKLLEKRELVLKQIGILMAKKEASDREIANIRANSGFRTIVMNTTSKRKTADLTTDSQPPKRVRGVKEFKDSITTSVKPQVFTLKDLLRKGEESRRKTQQMQQKKYVLEVPALQGSPKSIPPRQKDDTTQYILISQSDDQQERLNFTLVGALQQPTQELLEKDISSICGVGEKVYDPETVALFDNENEISQWRKKKQFSNN